jgi:hypothetical protein
VNGIDTPTMRLVFDASGQSDRIIPAIIAGSLLSIEGPVTQIARNRERISMIKRSDNRLHIFIATFLFSTLV